MQLTFTGTGSNDMIEWQIRWWLDFVETVNMATNDLAEMCIWLGKNVKHETPGTIEEVH